MTFLKKVFSAGKRNGGKAGRDRAVKRSRLSSIIANIAVLVYNDIVGKATNIN